MKQSDILEQITVHDQVNFSHSDQRTLKVNAIVFLVLDFILIVSTILANGSFIAILIKRRILHTPSNMLLGALCTSDLFIGLAVQPLYWTHKLTDKVNFHGSNCDIPGDAVGVLFEISFGLSFTFIILISLDRYFAICHPYTYHAKATCKTHLYVSVISGICVASLFCLNLFFPQRVKSYKTMLGLTTALKFLHYLLPFALILFCYVKIYLVILKQRRAKAAVCIEASSYITACTNGLQDSHVIDLPKGKRRKDKAALQRRKQEKDKAESIAIILVCFFICYGPNFVICVLEIDGKTVAVAIIIVWAHFMLFVSSLLNPIVYYLRCTAIRTAAVRTIYAIVIHPQSV